MQNYNVVESIEERWVWLKTYIITSYAFWHSLIVLILLLFHHHLLTTKPEQAQNCFIWFLETRHQNASLMWSFSLFSVMLTLGTYSTICFIPPPKNGFFNVHFGPEGVIIEIFLGTSNYLKVDFFFGKSPWGILIDGAFQCEWWSFVKIDAHLDSYLFSIFLFIIIEPFFWESFMICVLSCSGNKYKLFIRSRWSHYWLPKWLSLFRRGNDKFIVCKNEWQILAVNIVCACFMNQ